MKLTRNGFTWLDVTKKAKEVYTSGIFELYVLHEDGSESLVQSDDDLNVAFGFGELIGIEVGHQEENLKNLYCFAGDYQDSLKKAYKSIPKGERKFNYTQFVVTQFSILLDK